MSLSKALFSSSLVLTSLLQTGFSCTTGGNQVVFESTTLTSVASCDDNYDDPNDMGMNLFSLSSSGSNTKVSPNFALGEFACKDGDDKLRLSVGIVQCVQAVREDINAALSIKESYRTVSYNEQANGAEKSRHLSGTAAVVFSYSVDVLDVAESVICNCKDKFESYGYGIGLGLGSDYVHVDIRDDDSYWTETGSQYSSSEWYTFISDSHDSCGSGGGGGGSFNDDPNTNSDGSIAFPLVDLYPVYYSSWIYNDPNDMGTNLFSVNSAGRWTYLSDNFRVDEFACNDGSDGFRLIPELVECLQLVRDDLKISINVNSGYRTVSYNSQVGGASMSRHMSGTAADIQQYTISHWDFVDSIICNCRALFISNGQESGLGLGYAYAHVDMRPWYAYWVYSGASLSEYSWGQYISSTWSKCPRGAEVQTINGNKTVYEVGQEDTYINENDDINDDIRINDIDSNEIIEDLVTEDNDKSSKDDKGFFQQWWGILITVLVVVIICSVIGYFGYGKCKTWMDEKSTHDQFSSGYTKIDIETSQNIN